MFILVAAAGCSQDGPAMRNGYYSAVARQPDSDGWKHFITLYVYNRKIVTAEYNARNASGLLLDWDVLTVRRIKQSIRMHPSRIMREYTQELLNMQSPENIRRIPGDNYFYDRFTKLAAAALERASAGDRSVAEVELSYGESRHKHNPLP